MVLSKHDEAWSDPDAVTDLLLALRYSGADVVELPVEAEHTECFADALVGGPVMIDRSLLHELGGFEAIATSGCSIYRAHALLDHDESEAP